MSKISLLEDINGILQYTIYIPIYLKYIILDGENVKKNFLVEGINNC